MTILILGLLVFILIHAVPMMPSLREAVIDKIGAIPYRGVFAAFALTGVGLIVWGKSVAPFVPLYDPVVPKQVSYLLVLVSFILFPAAHMPTNIKRFLRHPMLWGIFLWALGHLLANGDQASVWLFGGFLFYSIIAMKSATSRGAEKSTTVLPVSKDLMVVVAGGVVYAVLFFLHGTLFGYPLG